MRFKLSVGMNFTRSIDSTRKKKNGFSVSVNDYCVEFRLRESYENSPYGDGPTKSHGWQQKRNGIYKEAFVRLPFNACIELVKNEMDYAQAVGLKDMSLDWIIDEFDASFNDLAIASMRYHMDWAVTYCDDETRAHFEDLIHRLSQRGEANFPADEAAHLESHSGSFSWKERRNCEECAAIFANYRVREEEARQDQMKARHDFVEIMPRLWS